MSNPLLRAIAILTWVVIASVVLMGLWQFAMIFTGTIEIGGGTKGFALHAFSLVVSIVQSLIAPVTLLLVLKLYADKQESRT